MNLGLHNRLLDSLTFEYYGDFTADGDEKAVVRVYANDGAGADGVAQEPGTMLYESDPIAIAAGYNSVAVSGLLIEVPDTITWTVQFFGVGGSEGDRAGLVLHDPPSVGSSFDDFWINTGDVIYNSQNDTVEAYYKTGTEFGDEINLGGSSRLLNSIDFEAYAEISSAPSAATATLRIYANDGAIAHADVPGSKTPGTLLFTSDPITLSEGYKTYRVGGIGVELPDTVTWTVEFSGVTGNELNVGNRAALVLGGTDVVGSSLDDFWQKDESGWTTYQTSSATQDDDFTARLVAQSWRSYRDTDSVVLDNFGARMTAGVNVDFLEAANVPLVVVNPGLQADWGVADNATYAEGAALPSGAAAPERRAFVSSTDDTAAIGQAIDWVLETGITTSPSGAELKVGESVTLSAAGYGPGDVTYQWKKDGANIDGQTGTDFALDNVATGAAGTYSVVVTGSNGGQAEASAEVKVFSLPAISMNRPVEGSTTSAITHQVKLWAIGGVDKIDLATASILINGVNVTDNAKVTDGRRGLQATVDLVENADTDTIAGTFLGYETLAPGTDNAMNVSLAFEPVGGDRVFTYSWSYTLYDASASGGSGIAKMAVSQIFQRGDDLYVIWPGSPGLVLERNSDCKGGTWETIPSTVGKGIHVEKNCGTKAFFRLVRVRE